MTVISRAHDAQQRRVAQLTRSPEPFAAAAAGSTEIAGMQVTVVGCGVIGMSISAALVDAGAVVNVIAEKRPTFTTSCVAAGLIEPVAGTADPAGAALELDAFRRSYRTWAARALSRDGLVVRRRVIVYTRGRTAPLPWHDAVDDYRELSRGERHPLFVDHQAAAFTSLVVDTRRWLEAAHRHLEARGVRFTIGRVNSLDLPGDLIVNAAGVQAGLLAGDDSVFRGDGHVVYVRRPAGVRDVLMEESRSEADMRREALPINMRYLIPRVDDVVLGGTLIDSADLSREPRPWPQVARRILELAIEIEPRLSGAPVLGYRVAARPRRRAGTRLDLERSSGRPGVLHCYGCGGSGWTLAPALSEMALALLAGRGIQRAAS